MSPAPVDPPDVPGPGPPGYPGQPPGNPGQPPGNPDSVPGRSDGAGPPGYLDQPLGEFLDKLAAGHAAPGGGSAAALAVALGASLCAMAARLSAAQLSDPAAGLLAAEADRLRSRAASLIQADAESYRSVIDALRGQANPGLDPTGDVPGPAAEQRRQRIDTALSQAATVPMEVVEIAAQTARHAARLAASGNPRLRGDAITAALLAQAGARAAAVLISINLAAATGAGQPEADQTEAGQRAASQTEASQTQASQTEASQSQAGQTEAGQSSFDRPARAEALLAEIAGAVRAAVSLIP